MNVEQWIKDNYEIVNTPWNNEDSISWGDGLFTPISNFLLMFEDVIQNALDDGMDVKHAIRVSDPDNVKGFNDIL